MIIRKYIVFYLFLIGIVFYSCQLKTDSSDITHSVISDIPNEIVLIFQNCPPDINTFRWTDENGSYGAMGSYVDISYVDSAMAFASTRILLKKTPDSDTVTIALDTTINALAVTHGFNSNENAIYLFRRGDTVLFTYKENIPYATVLNRETSFPESNYTVFIREHVTNNRMTALSFYSHYLFNDILRYEGPNKNRLTIEDKQMKYLCEKEQISNRKQALDLAIEEVIHEYKLQDSLHNAGLLSDYDYDYRRLLISEVINYSFVRDISAIQNPDYITIRSDVDLSEEKFAKFTFLRQLYNYQRDLNVKVNHFLRDIKPVMINNGGSGEPSPLYYIARLDTISHLDFLSAKSKHSFLANELKQIVETGDRNDMEKYCKKFIAITGDTLFVNRLLAENKMDFSNSDELQLIDSDNNRTNLQEVLKKNKGNVIYLDFWASWCLPCKASMPDAKRLREEYKNKGVTFIYLALNDEEDRWKADEKKLAVNYLSESYFITNSKTAHILADWKVKAIPRYLLYDKKGKLVHLNAPGPHGNGIRKLFDKFLHVVDDCDD
jgi:thiol-disulfide isomerase/thioredoxin